MEFNKKNIMILSLGLGILTFFFGIGIYFLIGASTVDNRAPYQVSSFIKISGMGLICLSMIVGGFFVEKIDKDTKSLLLIFGIILLLLNIFILSYMD